MTSIFISYSSKDVKIAETIQKCLEDEDFNVWRDKRKIEADWSNEIADSLTKQDIILLLWTKNASGSHYVKSEWMTARALGKVLKPIIFSKDKLNEELPDPLKNIQAIIDFKETNQIDRNIQELIESLKNIDSFTCDYNYNILPTKRNIRYTSNKDFVGRDEDIVNIYLEIIGGLNKLHYQQVGLVGMPGVGKTQLAAEFAYRYAYQFEKGVYWVQGADPTKWLQEIVNVAKHPELKLKIDKSDDKKEDDKKYFLAFYNYCKEFGKEVLLIVDNVNEANSLYEQDILFPNDPTANYNLLNLGCNILFTTRKNFDLSAEGVIQHPVTLLHESPSYDLLIRYRKPTSLQEEKYARSICSRVGYLPLALVLAQAYLKRNTVVQFRAYDEELAKKRLHTIDIGKIKNEQLVTQHIAAVRVTFDEMWNILEAKDQDVVQTNQNAKKMLYLISLFAESAIVPKARLAIFSGLGKLEPLVDPAEDAFDLLEELNLIDILEDQKSVRTHPLLREYALEKLDKASDYRRMDLEKDSIFNLKRTYYDNFPSLVREYVERNSDIDSIREDFETVLLWSKGLTSSSVADALTKAESDINSISELNKIINQESHNLRLTVTNDSSINQDKQVTFAQAVLIRSFDLNNMEMANKSREFLIQLKEPFLDIRWARVRSKNELIRTLEGHYPTVTSVAITSDNSKIVSGSDDKTIKVWDMNTGKLLNTLKGHSLWVTSVAVTSDNSKIVSGSFDKTIKVWDMNTGKLLNTLKGHSSGVYSVAVTSDNSKIVSGSYDKTIKVWDLNTGELLRTLKGHSYEVWSVAITSDNSKIVSGSYDKTIKVWDMNTGELLHTLEGHTNDVRTIAITSDNSKIVSGSDDKTIKVWDMNTAKVLKTLEGHSDKISSVAITSDNSKIVSGSNDTTIKVWDLNTGDLFITSKGHSDCVSSIAITSDNSKIVSGSWDNTIKVWDMNTGKHMDTIEGHSDHVESVAITSDNTKIVTGSGYWAHGTINLWDLNTGKLLNTLEGHSDSVYSIAITPDNSKIVSGGDDNTFKVWDMNTGKVLKTLEGHSDCVSSIAVTSDNSKIVSGSWDNTIKVWDLHQGKCYLSDKFDAPITSVSLSKYGNLIALGDSVGNLYTGRLYI